MRKLLALLLAAMTIAGTAAPAMAAEDVPPATVSKAYVVMDAKTGQVLLQKNMYEKKYPASITKILTTALGLLYADPDDKITVSQETVSDIWKWGETTHLSLEPGEVITLRDALYGAMVESANDCANAIAQAVSGNLSDFAGLMNEQAAALGLTETHFTNAHGLPDPEHYTTAYDMARITRWAMTVPGFEEYFCATEYSIPRTNKKNVQRNIGTHHHMLVESAYYYPYAKGGKLGLPTKAELEELKTKCTWTWTTQGGHKGYKVTSKINGKSIFLPAAGWRYGTSRSDVGEYGYYWGSTPGESSAYGAYYLGFYSSFHGVGWRYRINGFSVRPVVE